MAKDLIDRADGFLARHRTSLTIVAAAWFWIGVAVAARFIDLPWRLPEWLVLVSGIAVNAGWWGFLRPAIERRRAMRSPADG